MLTLFLDTVYRDSFPFSNLFSEKANSCRSDHGPHEGPQAAGHHTEGKGFATSEVPTDQYFSKASGLVLSVHFSLPEPH